MDLIKQVQQWKQARKEVLLGMDANKDIDDPRSTISKLFTKTRLIDLHNYRYPTQRKLATFQCGSSPIDVITGTTLLAEALTLAWILPFGMPPLIKGDHLLGIDFNPDILFRNTPTSPATGIIRGLNSNHE